MPFTLNIPGLAEPIVLEIGDRLFVLGANGTGKSALLTRLVANSGASTVKRVSATRQTWFNAGGPEFSPSQKGMFEQQTRGWDTHPESRVREQNPQIRTSLAIYDLIDAENVDSRQIAAALREGDEARAVELAKNAAPIAQINELLALSNIPIEISIASGDQLMASKLGSEPYPASELSDGERNALLIGAEILTAKPGTLLIVDEPERHLHRSIISPLLSRLFNFREDCAFIIATHDLMLPIDNPEARVLLIRSCSYAGNNNVASWQADMLAPTTDVDEQIKRDIVGARRRIIFVEGEDSSLDRPIYSILFPEVSVRAKGSAREVEEATQGIRATDSLHWVEPFGIIDNDGRSSTEVQTLAASGIYALPFYSVESIYYHPYVIGRIAERQAAVVGGDPAERVIAALSAAVGAVRPHLDRLAARAVEKTIRTKIFAALPTLEQIRGKQEIRLEVDTARIVDSESRSLREAADAGDWLRIASRCPIRETPARDTIASALGFKSRWLYEEAVLQLLRTDQEAVTHLRGFFGELPRALGFDDHLGANQTGATEPDSCEVLSVQ